MKKITYYEELPHDATPGEYALINKRIWKCFQYSKNNPDAIKWRIVKLKEP